MQPGKCSRRAVDFDRDIVPVYFTLMVEARRYFRDERAQDLAAEAMTRALERRCSYDGTRPLLPWCRTIMRNLWINSLRQECRTVPLGEWDTDGGEPADMLAIVGETMAVINSMRSRSVSVATLVEFASGYSVAEIARTSGVPVGTVKRRVHDGRALLAKMLAG